MVDDHGTLSEHGNEVSMKKNLSCVIHVGGLGDGTYENEKRLTSVFGKFGGVVAVTLQRRREVSFQWKNPDFLIKSPDFLLKMLIL